MTASAADSSVRKPDWACCWRRWPSKSKGNVTMARTSAPPSRANRASTGAAPVPVPPPSPARMKTISAPAQNEAIFSASSSAAARPRSGSPPVPRPRVRRAPSTNLCAAADASRACESVLTARISTPSSTLASRALTALQPAPPTPHTLMEIFFLSAGSSILSSVGSVIIRP